MLLMLTANLPGLRQLALVTLSLSTIGLTACSGGAGSVGMIGVKGEELPKPDGSGTFFNEENDGGGASTIKLLDVSWGRLVDVHDIDELTGDVDPSPVFRDFVINETIASDGQNYLLETNPVTQRTRLVVLREKRDGPTDEFTPLLLLAADSLSPIQPKSDAPGTLPPFSYIARNAALVLRFNDLLEDGEAARLNLSENIKLLTDYPPSLPYQDKRIFFDPNHGGLVGSGEFHSTRVIIDLTVSESEAASMAIATGLNSLGLPASLTTTTQANTAIRIPSEIADGSGQLSRLENLVGHGMATSDNGPVDFSSDSIDVVRAMRSGNADDENNGFLLDLNPPELVSGWPIVVTNAVADPEGEPGFDFLLDIQFTSDCQAQPVPGNIIELPGRFTEVSGIGLAPGLDGSVSGLEVRSLGEEAIASSALLGGALFKRTYEPALLPADQLACWLSFQPLPGSLPADAIDPNSQIVLRFSEPMDPATITAFDTFLVQRTQEDPEPQELVVGEVSPSGDLKEFTYTPVLPFDHLFGNTEEYFVSIVGDDGITDLAGNAPVGVPPLAAFRIDTVAPTVSNGGMVLTFDAFDEVRHPALYTPPPAEDPQWADWRGQFLFEPERGLYKPRPLVRTAAIADRSQAVPGIMIPFAPGVQTPLAPLGSKLMTVWRYCDVGFSSQDETNYNLDIEGLSWSPIGAQIVSDYYPEFEVRLAHSHYLPDESLDQWLLPAYQDSGLSPTTFAENILDDPASPQTTVHERHLGYVLNPVDLFLTGTGTFMMPFPVNRDTEPEDDDYYTWRDTAIQAKAGPNGIGMDLMVMADVGLVPAPDPGGAVVPGEPGYTAGPNQVPSIGLPLLMEFRTYPAEEGVGLNAFDISLAINTSRLPAFRVFSTGGLNQSGVQVSKHPDLETEPSGGFNPNSTPPGKATPEDDNSFYIGQMDVITRVSRIHSIWIDTTVTGNGTDFLDPLVEPTADHQPAGTELVFAYRGASAVSGESMEVGKGYAFRADHIDPYGDVRKLDTNPATPVPEFIGSLNDVTFFPLGDTTWKDDLDDLDQARYFQMRVTFVGNTTTLLNPEFAGIGIAWATDG